MWKLLLIPAAALLCASCSDTPAISAPDSPTAAAAQPLFATLYSNVRESRRILIRDEETWAALWAGMVGSAGSISAPRVDFTTEDVLVAAMGEQSVAGYAIQIADVRGAGTGLRVSVTSTIPNPGCNGSEVITTPLDAVRIPKVNGPIQFDERASIKSCN